MLSALQKMLAIMVGLSSLTLGVSAQSLRNVTVKNNDTSISYTGLWFDGVPSGSSGYTIESSSYRWSNAKENGTLSFKFTGVALYYLSPTFQSFVGANIALDDPNQQISVTIQLNDDDTESNDPASADNVKMSGSTKALAISDDGQFSNLPNEQHTIQVSPFPFSPFTTDDQNFIAFDGFIYTVDDSASPSSSASQPSNSNSPNAGDGDSGSATHLVTSKWSIIFFSFLSIAYISFS
ncbi:hypothetical protein K435DRAFT_75978 [Dendrothele bispora CBS 962.96]|uniref:Concanavalin A-like lectin/glucanase n=1 Tax=Dendrothele bispora (strain CBS 962.96) TaxID=1314807 RepID=A0A4S8MS67_DENBC|nr:hypothetical protein K435DRAFT_75978 [Dendrothele bispora CBS 962.96]